MTAPRPLDSRAVGLMLVLCAIWGLQQVVLKATATDIAPIWQIGLRSAAASVLVGLVMLARGERMRWSDGILARRPGCWLAVWGRISTRGRRLAPHQCLAHGGVFVHRAHVCRPGSALAATRRAAGAAAMAGCGLGVWWRCRDIFRARRSRTRGRQRRHADFVGRLLGAPGWYRLGCDHGGGAQLRASPGQRDADAAVPVVGGSGFAVWGGLADGSDRCALDAEGHRQSGISCAGGVVCELFGVVLAAGPLLRFALGGVFVPDATLWRGAGRLVVGRASGARLYLGCRAGVAGYCVGQWWGLGRAKAKCLARTLDLRGFGRRTPWCCKVLPSTVTRAPTATGWACSSVRRLPFSIRTSTR